MMSCVRLALKKPKAAVFGGTKQVLEASVAYGYKQQHCGVARNNLVFSALSIFRVEGSVTLKMLNLLIVNQ